MKAAKIAMILVGILSLIFWVRSDYGDLGSLVKTLPFCGGHKPSFYDVGAVALIALLFSGLSRLKRSERREDDTSDVDYEYDDDGDGWEGDEDQEDKDQEDERDDY